VNFLGKVTMWAAVAALVVMSACAWLGRFGIEMSERRSFKLLKQEKQARAEAQAARAKADTERLAALSLQKDADDQRAEAVRQREIADRHWQEAERSRQGMVALERQMLEDAQGRSSRREARRAAKSEAVLNL